MELLVGEALEASVEGLPQRLLVQPSALAVWVAGPLAEASLVEPQSCADARPLVGSLLHVDWEALVWPPEDSPQLYEGLRPLLHVPLEALELEALPFEGP